MTTKYDEVFANIAGDCGGIEPLLDAFFGFLHRRTDFYVTIDEGVKAKMGFRKGTQKLMLMNAFDKYPLKLYSPPNPVPAPNQSLGRLPSAPSESSTSMSDRSNNNNNNNNYNNNNNTNNNTNNNDNNNSNNNNNNNSGSQTATGDVTTAEGISIKNTATIGKYTEDGRQIPIGNGGWASNYYWSQTLKETTVYIDLPNGTKSKSLKCIINKKNLSVKLHDAIMIDGELDEVVKTDESLWNISVDSKTGSTILIVTLDKSRPTWWKRVIVGDPEIDCSLIDSTQRIDDYDAETQATIRKLMTEHRDKRLRDHQLGLGLEAVRSGLEPEELGKK